MSQNDFDRQPGDSKKIGDIRIQGDNNTTNVVQGDNNTFNHTEIFQILAEEIKERRFIAKSPYKGLKKFESEDKDRFFGRDQFLKALTAELEQTNLVLLLGASGSGKSSVVRAGLIPWLDRQPDQWFKLTFTPDQDPFESLYRSLGGQYRQADAQIAREARVDTLTQVVTTLRQPDSHWLIFIDQFEELFTTSQTDKRDRFIESLEQLNAALKLLGHPKDCPVKTIATMRADFLDRLSPYPALVKATNQHRPMIAEMQSDELRMAIEQPAAHHGVVFEPGLVDIISKDVQGQAGYLPLLQYTLNLLWEQEAQRSAFAQDRTLQTQTYRDLGGVRGALQKHVDQIYDSLTEPERVAAQRIFLKLVEIGGDEESGTEWKPVRRRAARSEFQDASEERVLTRLINENLLVSSLPVEALQNRQPQAQESTVEIAHEILLTSWEKLHTWIKENRQAIALRNRLNDDVVRWQAKKKEDELWTGSKLEQVLELRKDSTFNQVIGGFSSNANQFIDASLGLRDRIRKRQIRQARTIASVSIGAVVLVSVAGVVAMFQRQEAIKQRQEAVKQRELAERQNKIALARQLIAQAEAAKNQGPTQFQHSMLLAIEGTRRLNDLGIPSAEGEAILRYGLSVIPALVSANSIESYLLLKSKLEPVLSQGYSCQSRITSNCVSPNGRFRIHALTSMGASVGQTNAENLIKIEDKKSKKDKIIPLSSTYFDFAFSADSRFLMIKNGLEAQDIRIYDLPAEQSAAKIIDTFTISQTSSNPSLALVFNKDEQLITYTKNSNKDESPDKVLRVFNLVTGARVQSNHSAGENILQATDRNYIAKLSSSKNILQILEVSANQIIFQRNFEELAKSLIIDPRRSSNYETLDGKKRLLHNLLEGAIAVHDNKIYSLFEGGSGVTLWQLPKNEIEFVLNEFTFGAVWSQHGKYIATMDRFNDVNLIDVETKKLVNRFQNDGDTYSAPVFSLDEKYLAVVNWRNTVRIIEVSTGKEINRLEDEYADRIDSIAFSPNGKQLATLISLRAKDYPQHSYSVKVWSLDTQKLFYEVCSRLPRNFRSDEWKQLLGEIPYQKTCANLPEDLLTNSAAKESGTLAAQPEVISTPVAP